MTKNHLKRINAPRTWPVNRKGTKWIMKPSSGPHELEQSMPLNVVIRNLLGYAGKTKEVKKILHNKEILVDGISRGDVKFPVGIFDVISIPKTKENFLFLLNKKGKFFLSKLDEKYANLKYIQIIGKKMLKKNILQLNFSNGYNLIGDVKNYNVGDSIVINLKDKKVVNHLKLEKNSIVYVTGGSYVGLIGTINKLHSSNSLRNDMVELKFGDKMVNTLRKYVFVIDKDIIK